MVQTPIPSTCTSKVDCLLHTITHVSITSTKNCNTGRLAVRLPNAVKTSMCRVQLGVLAVVAVCVSGRGPSEVKELRTSKCMHSTVLLYTEITLKVFKTSNMILCTTFITCPQMGCLSRMHTNQVVTQRLRWCLFQTGKKYSAFFRRMPLRKADWASQAHISLLFCC